MDSPAGDSVFCPNAVSTSNCCVGDGVGAPVCRQASGFVGGAHNFVIDPRGRGGVHESLSEYTVYSIRVPCGHSATRWADNGGVVGGMQALASAVEMREGGRESGSVCEGVDFLRPTTDFFASVSKETRVKINELEFVSRSGALH